MVETQRICDDKRDTEQLVMKTDCYKYNDEFCLLFQKLAASYMMWNNVILAFPVLLILPVCGSWSDSTNKKHPIILCAGACCVAAFVFWVRLPLLYLQWATREIFFPICTN